MVWQVVMFILWRAATFALGYILLSSLRTEVLPFWLLFRKQASYEDENGVFFTKKLN